MVENFVIIKKVLLEFRNLWRYSSQFSCSIVTLNVVEIEKLLGEPFRIVLELAFLCKSIGTSLLCLLESECVSTNSSINNMQGIVESVIPGFADGLIGFPVALHLHVYDHGSK